MYIKKFNNDITIIGNTISDVEEIERQLKAEIVETVNLVGEQEPITKIIDDHFSADDIPF